MSLYSYIALYIICAWLFKSSLLSLSGFIVLLLVEVLLVILGNFARLLRYAFIFFHFWLRSFLLLFLRLPALFSLQFSCLPNSSVLALGTYLLVP